jgi:crotonobetainyl-CoA:carnitine CoA-transferase CaiB-like acyl-CoA transferase
MRMPLEDVKVLDLSHALAGPFCSTMLADFGASVIKLEPPGDGDIARSWGPPLPGGETSYFVSLHRNKKGIEVDLKHPQGKELYFRLVERCDVVLENYRVGALARLGLGYEAAREKNPGIIYCSVSGFGQDGPYRDRAALDLILQAESGMISVTGEPGGHGVRCGVSIADMTAGMYAAFGILLALRVKEKTGRGQAIDVSMLEGQLSLLGTMIGGYLADRQVPAPMGTAYKALLPYQTFRTRTRDLALAVGSEKLWRVFCPAIGRPELADDPRYRTNADRARNRSSLIAMLQDVFLTRTYEEWETLLLASGIPVGAINDIAQVVRHPQVAARGALVEMDHPRAGKVRMVGAPVRLSETPGAVRTPAPLLGEHTDEVLRDLLGLGAEEVAALRAAGALGVETSAADPGGRPSAG